MNVTLYAFKHSLVFQRCEISSTFSLGYTAVESCLLYVHYRLDAPSEPLHSIGNRLKKCNFLWQNGIEPHLDSPSVFSDHHFCNLF